MSSALPALSRTRIVLVFAVWTAVTLPLVTLGPGSDVDAWTVARTAERIWESATYIRSRTSGFPLYEIAIAPAMHLGGTVATNVFSLVCGLVCIGLWLRLVRGGVIRWPLPTLLSFAFLPPLIKNAASTMDYVPALALLLGAYVAWETRHWFWCAVLIGIACGVRPTSALFIVPAALGALVARTRVTTALMMVAVAAVVGTVAFWPSLRLGGFGPVRSVNALQGARTALALFGILQTPLLVATAWFFAERPGRWSAFDVFHLTNIAIFGIAFAIHPGGMEYLLPIAPSVLLLIDRHVSMAGVVTSAVILLSHHFVALDVQGSRGGLRPVTVTWTSGFTVRDIEDRRFKLWLKDAVRNWPGTVPTILLELQMQPFAADPEWTYDANLNAFRPGASRMAVAALTDDTAALRHLRAEGFRVVARQERHWQYRRPEGAAARALIEFVDDLGALLGTPVHGAPLE